MKEKKKNITNYEEGTLAVCRCSLMKRCWHFGLFFFGISGLAHLEGGILAPGSSPNDGRFDMRRRAKGTVKSHFAADAFFCMYELAHLCLKVIIDNVKKNLIHVCACV